jgi:hypothetical protein
MAGRTFRGPVARYGSDRDVGGGRLIPRRRIQPHRKGGEKWMEPVFLCFG